MRHLPAAESICGQILEAAVVASYTLSLCGRSLSSLQEVEGTFITELPLVGRWLGVMKLSDITAGQREVFVGVELVVVVISRHVWMEEVFGRYWVEATSGF